ncbi:acetyl-CoA acetyltransferase [Azospirillum brasilense]|uniref:Acetyl-CoA acetyltransferase n=1 Tax=Azospirillum brasilense TaxID=192 RepID=A0A560C3Z0_AZOBR|nr:acetyl-CoA acetyltransferase [Azospirillum brasilense]TWA79573.1 acetyl-CoA acetyltransferase [Azospirillum brasilense]
MIDLSGKAAIAGVFESPRRDAPRVHPFALQMDCILGALDDAGLTLKDVDGLCAASGDWAEGGSTMDVVELAEYIGIAPTYVNSTDVGGCSYILQAGQAAAAIATGLAEVVVISYAACPRWWPLSSPSFDPFVFPAGPGQYEIPYAPTLISTYGLFARRHMDLYGTTPEQLAQVAVTFREHAATNPDARLRKPITVDDVLASPMIASPLHRLDCCVVTDGGGAVVMTSRERARDLKKPPVHLVGYGAAVARTQNSQIPDDLTTPAALSGPRAFAMAGLTPGEIDVAQIYDAFTITPMLALEDLGFCGRGESGAFVADGNLTLGGRLPTNTDGGGLSSNHPGKRGIFTLIESVRQLRGEGPGVQVPDARIALAHGLGGTFCSAATAILAR